MIAYAVFLFFYQFLLASFSIVEITHPLHSCVAVLMYCLQNRLSTVQPQGDAMNHHQSVNRRGVKRRWRSDGNSNKSVSDRNYNCLVVKTVSS